MNLSASQLIDQSHSGSAGIITAIAAGIAVIAGIAGYPVDIWLLIPLLLAYSFLLWFQPWSWLFVIPALLPTIDFSPVTGRLLLDEFDLIVLVTIGVGYWRTRTLKPNPWPNRFYPLAVFLLCLTWGIATLRGLWPVFFMTGRLAASAPSPLEAWNVGKGLLWALLLVPLIRRVPLDKTEKIQRWVLHGLIIGLVIVDLVVIWERYVFVGLANFDNVFRVTGTFASMNTGGAYIEAYIAFAFPALAVWILEQRRKWLICIGLAGMAITSYAMFVTFSRGGYAGLIIGLGFVVISSIWLRTGSRVHRILIMLGLACVTVAVAFPILSGGFARYRLSRSLEDLAIRKAHWTKAIGLMDPGLMTKLTGMGFGQYPRVYMNRAAINKPPGTFKVIENDANPFLQLSGGEPLYLDQLVDVDTGTKYTLSARIRQPLGSAVLAVPVCEKALLYSFACAWQQLTPDTQGTAWQTITLPLSTKGLNETQTWLEPPMKLSLYNPGPNPVDVDDVSLKTDEGRELVKNGDFGNGVKRWLFVTDQDLAWHIHQQEIEMYFAQGLLGVFAFMVLLVAVTIVLLQAVRTGNAFATAIAGGLLGFLTVGLLGSTMDTARLSMLFYLGAIVGGLLTQKKIGVEN